MSSSSRREHEDPETSVSDSFGQLDLSGSSQSSQPTNPKVFRDGRAARPSDVFIALMGVTGSGKSAFISLCCQRAAKVGHELKACMTVVDVYAYELSASRTVYLIDTPGFDDTSRSDTDVLREIAGWLTVSYSNKVLLHGIIYLHRITDVRMQGSAKKNLLMFKKLCGDDALRNVVLATTMWDKVPNGEAEDREQQLVDTQEFWGFMISKGSTVYRHNNTVESANQIVEELARGNGTVTLDLQNQMVNENQNLNETAAGREIESELIKERQRWAAELKDTQEQMMEAIHLRDKESEQALRELKGDFITRMQRLEQDNKRLHIDAEQLRDAKIKKLEEAFEKQNQAHTNELKKLQLKNVKVLKGKTPMLRPESAPVSVSSKAWQDTEPQEFFWSENLREQYPKLRNNLNSSATEPAKVLWICLGPKQSFYAKLKDGSFYNLPRAVMSAIHEIEGKGDITAVALGIHETYVIVYGGKLKWDLKSYYVQLDTHLTQLQKTLSTPRLVALNPDNETDFLILTDSMVYVLDSCRLGKKDLKTFLEWKHDNGVQRVWSWSVLVI